MYENAKKGCEILLLSCAGFKNGDSVLVVTDEASRDIGMAMYQCALCYTDATIIKTLPRKTHGSAPTAAVAAAMASADIIFGATTFSMYNTAARIDACKSGSRFINMADYSMEMLEEGCLFVDFAQIRKLLDGVADRITGSVCHITTPAGTDLTASITGRMAVNGYGIANKPGMASSPPDVETAVGPLDDSVEGVIVVDGSIPLPGLGLIEKPIRLEVKKGHIVKIEGGRQAEILRQALDSLQDERVYQVGEIGFGMNTGAKLSGRMLEDEGTFGTIHIGIGNNLSYGGTNAIPVHIDLIMLEPTYSVDNKYVYRDGKPVDKEG